MVNYTISRGGNKDWPTREYTLEDVVNRAAKDGRIVRDGYGRTRVRQARKLIVTDMRGKRPPVVFVSTDQSQP